MEKGPSKSFDEHASQRGSTESAAHTHQDSMKQLNSKLGNPLRGVSQEELIARGADFAKQYGMSEHTQTFSKGALIAQDPSGFDSMPLLNEEDRKQLRRELTHKWDQPITLYYLVVLCSVAAAVQGMDETVVNGAQVFFSKQFGIDPKQSSRNEWLQGMVISAPYLCCAIIGCWLTEPLNHFFGRRGTIFITGAFSFLTCIWQGVTNSWQHLFVARFLLGLGIGPKSATVPVYAAECAPPAIRGALVMMWQTWTAFGIMIGYVADLVFYKVPDKPGITGLNWRLMVASAGIPALILVVQVFFVPESPRWLIKKGRYSKAFESLCRLRRSNVQAARDLYYIHVLLEAEKEVKAELGQRNRFLEIFTVPRNRRAALASFIVMFMQQFCGINVIAYYSSNVFLDANFSEIQALLASFGVGAINFFFALPAIYTIDTFGRRFLLLTTFPLMAIFMFMTGFAFWIPETSKAHLGVIALGMYLFTAAYSPGSGPVPFTYSAEAYPLYVREIGMSLATSILWFFNFVIAITFPPLLGAFKPQGAFAFYGAWNIVGFVLALLFVPETKALSLEELDQVFGVPTHVHAAYQLKWLPYAIKKHIFRMNIEPMPPLYDEDLIGEKSYAPAAGAA